MSERKPCRTDLADEQWAFVEPVIAAWKAAHRSVSGHQNRYGVREIVNTLLCQGRTGCRWDLLPHDLPPRGAVLYHFTKWRDDGTGQDLIRALLVRIDPTQRRFDRRADCFAALLS
ncbi:transposase [Streptomyces sp. NPDC088766]|uniref:transposase n=1 Tax=Streptomyces sp. NPDC088766 TaxID=3365893 RepID=UPI00380843C0